MDGPRSLRAYLKDFSGYPLPIRPPSRRCLSEERKAAKYYLENATSQWRQMVAHAQEMTPPMGEEVRLAVLVPARHEAARLPRMLSALARESEVLRSRLPGILEVLVLNNRRENEQNDCTKRAVEQWREEWAHPFSVHMLDWVWPAGTKTALTLSRKLLADMALARSLARASPQGPLYLLSEDADVEAIQAGRSAAVLHYMDRHAEVDALRGRQDRTPTILARNHLLLLERRIWYLTESLLSNNKLRPEQWNQANFYWNRVVTSGWNTAFSAHAYATIGGYSGEVTLFEDMDIGQRISVMRGGWRGGRFVPNTSTVRRIPHRAYSSAIRALMTLSEERHIYDHGAGFESFIEISDHDIVRSGNYGPLLERVRPWAQLTKESAPRYERVVSNIADEIIRIMGGDERAHLLFTRAMMLVGFPPGSWHRDRKAEIKLYDLSKFQAGAEAFSRRWLNPDSRPKGMYPYSLEPM